MIASLENSLADVNRREPQPQVEVLAMAKRGVIPADRQHDVAAEHRRRVADQLPTRTDRLQERLVVERMTRAPHLQRAALLVDILAPAADDAIVWVGFEEGDLLRKPLRMADVVGIHPGHDRRAGFGHKLVEAGDKAPILADDRPDARIAGGIFANDRRRGVAAAVVQDQEFEVGEGLREHAVDRLVQEALAIIDAHRDRDRGLCHRKSPSCSHAGRGLACPMRLAQRGKQRMQPRRRCLSAEQARGDKIRGRRPGRDLVCAGSLPI